MWQVPIEKFDTNGIVAKGTVCQSGPNINLFSSNCIWCLETFLPPRGNKQECKSNTSTTIWKSQKIRPARFKTGRSHHPLEQPPLWCVIVECSFCPQYWIPVTSLCLPSIPNTSTSPTLQDGIRFHTPLANPCFSFRRMRLGN